MRRVTSLYSSSVGKKIFMAFSGAFLFLFVVGHLVGNLKLYQGPEKFNAYAKFLREVGYPALGHGQLLWIVRIVLLAVVFVHVVAATQLTLRSWGARKIGYRSAEDLSFSYASRTMRWGGVVLGAFVVFHLLHLTWGVVLGGFRPEDPYFNVVAGFRQWWIGAAYIVAMVPLGLHLYHGLWSATQTLALTRPRCEPWRRPAAAVIAVAITLANISIPVSVWLDVVKTPPGL